MQPSDIEDIYRERMAIMIEEGGQPHNTAEQAAWEEVCRAYAEAHRIRPLEAVAAVRRLIPQRDRLRGVA